MKVFVTGASSGIGAASARALAAAGHTVGTCARREDRLRELAEETGGPYWVADLADLDSLDALAAKVDEEMGGVDVLVNNAGVPKRRRTKAMTATDLEDVMAMNYHSPVRLALAFLPRMLERGSGEIVNVSSMGVHSAAFGVGAYSASKAALELFTEALYLELAGSGVRARVLVPGTTATEFSDDKPDNEPSMVKGAPGGATAEDVASALVASLGDDRYITYAMPKDEAGAAAKAADPNAFLATAREALKAFL
ncbi:MAG: adh 1 [Actinomycetia bacterium]|nr:adh 1 [Actinomycetes bacterium]